MGDCTQNRRYYFAYGANIRLEKMKARCPGAEFVALGDLFQHEFRIQSDGYATVVPRKGSSVHGVLWTITPEDEKSLDVYEEIEEEVYFKKTASIRLLDDRSVDAFLYVATNDRASFPKPGYLEPIIDACRVHGFPQDYVYKISAWIGKRPASPPEPVDRFSQDVSDHAPKTPDHELA